VLEASLPQAFQDAAVETFARSRWEPGVKAGKRVPSVKQIEVRFEPPVSLERQPIAPEN
jgi:hypothetical protein